MMNFNLPTPRYPTGSRVIPQNCGIYQWYGPAPVSSACLAPQLIFEHMTSFFRRPTASDLTAMVGIHCDPRTNAYNPSGPPSPTTVASMLDAWLAHWVSHGFGYWAISEVGDKSRVLGFGGVMRKQVGSNLGLNLYFRLSPEAWGRGLGIAIAERAIKLAFVDLKEPEVLALVRPDNFPSRRTIERARLTLFDTFDDVPGQEHSLIYRIQREQYAGGT